MYEENFCIKRIRELMEQNDFNAYRLAKKSGIAHSTVKSMLEKNTEPHIETLRKFCAAFGITMAQFFEQSSRDVTDEQRELLDAFLQLPVKKQKKIFHYLKYISENDDE